MTAQTRFSVLHQVSPYHILLTLDIMLPCIPFFRHPESFLNVFGDRLQIHGYGTHQRCPGICSRT